MIRKVGIQKLHLTLFSRVCVVTLGISLLLLSMFLFQNTAQMNTVHAQSTCNQVIETVMLTNVKTGQDIRELANGETIQLDNTNLAHLGLRPVIDWNSTASEQNSELSIESIHYDLSGIFSITENLRPYTLQAAQIIALAGGYIPASTYHIGVTGYSENAANGTECDSYDLYFNLQNFACATVSEVSEQECDALVGFYYTTNGWQWYENSGWLANDTPCSWHGVTCAYKSGVGLQVSRVELPDNNLLGHVLEEIQNLSGLQSLNLAGNNLTEPLPPALGSLSELKILNFSANTIDAEIPLEWGALAPQLEEVYLDHNALFGEIPLAFIELPDEAILDLRYNALLNNSADIQNVMTERFPDWAETQTVPVTELRAEEITDTAVQLRWAPIDYHDPEHGGRYPIYYSTSPLGPFVIAGSTEDKEADGYLLETLTPDTIYYVTVGSYTPRHDLQKNELFQTSAPDGLVFRTESGAGYDCTNVSQIPYPECEALRAFYLETNGSQWIHNEGWLMDDRPCDWYGITCAEGQVVAIELEQNRLAGTLTVRLGNLSKLQSLSLSHNQLTGTIPREIGLLRALVILRLHHNQFSGEVDTILLKNLYQLAVLDLSYNRLSGPLPKSLATSSSLHTLFIAGNQFSGDIPANLSRLENLTEIDLAYNKLTASDSTLLAFLANRAPDWSETQTIPVADLTVQKVSTDTIKLNWTPIPYTADGGWYELGYVEKELDHIIPNNLDSALDISLAEGAINNIVQAGKTMSKKSRYFTLAELTPDRTYYIYMNSHTPRHHDQQNALYASKVMVISLSGDFDCSRVASIPPTECEALLALYHETDGDSWVDNSGWQIASDPCIWYGVQCREEHVVGLELSNNGLKGRLPDALGNLPNLEIALFDNNYLAGLLPYIITALNQLQFMVIDYNAVWTDDSEVEIFLDEVSPGWQQTQLLPPKEIQAAAEDSETIVIHWAEEQAENQEGFYEISYSPASTEPDEDDSKVTGVVTNRTSTEYRVGELEPNRAYNFRMRAYRPARSGQADGLWSDYSPAITALTLPLAACEQQAVDAALGEDEVCKDMDDHESAIILEADEFLTVKLPIQPSTGSHWYVVQEQFGEDDQGTPLLRISEQPTFYAPPLDVPILGRVVIENYHIAPIKAGFSTIRLEYRDPHGVILDDYTLHVNVVGTFDTNHTPANPAQPRGERVSNIPLYPPKLGQQGKQTRNRAMGQTQEIQAIAALPSKFSWCNHPDGNDYCPPIQNQGTCGSCWAFTTASMMESQIKIKDGIQRDLSEQHLLSCNSEDAGNGANWSCTTGGWYAFDYYTDKLSAPHNSGPGAVWELDFLYSGEDLACKPSLPHREQLTAWSYINPTDPFVVNYVGEIKDALYEYGPVITSLCVGPDMQNYQDGIFDSDESYICAQYGTSTNHAVIIVGWDDAEGAWIVRNSWDTGWGENGYMRIKYGTSNIGFAAAYALYDGTASSGPKSPSTLTAQPEEVADGYQMALTWEDRSDNETNFQISRQTGGESEWRIHKYLGADQSHFTDNDVRCNQPYRYRVQAANAEDSSGYSNTVKVVIHCPDLRAPSGFVASTGTDGILLEWENLNASQESIVVLRWYWESESWEEIAILDGETTRYEDREALDFGQTYSYIIFARSQGQNSPPTDYQSAQAPSIQLEGPSQASAETVSDGAIEISWADNSMQEDGYVVLRYDTATSQWAEIAELEADITTYVDSGLSCDGQDYYYQVVARKGTIWSGFSNQAYSPACIAIADGDIPLFTPTPTVTLTPVGENTHTPTPTPSPMPSPTVSPTPATIFEVPDQAMPTPPVTLTATPPVAEVVTATETPTPAPDSQDIKADGQITSEKIFLPIITK